MYLHPIFILKAELGYGEAIGDGEMLADEFLLQYQSHKGERCKVYTSADVVHSGIYKGEQANEAGVHLVLQLDAKTKSVYENVGTTMGDAVGDSIYIPISSITEITFE